MAAGVSRQGWETRLRGGRLATGLALAVSLGCVGSRDEGAPTGVTSDRVTLNRSCEGCHVQIAREWRGSRHHDAATNDAFSAAFRREPDPFCWDCHAPEARGDKGLDSARSQQGVACVTCHVDAHAHGDKPIPSRACASCHEFSFPSTARESPEMMQTTATEHARSAFATQSCSDCHMPRAGADQHRSHAFAATRDPEAQRRAVSVAAQRGGGALSLRIAPRGVGHAFPTGDLFRRLSVLAEVVDSGRVLRRERRYLARHFVHRLQADGVSRREEVGDDRPGSSPHDGGAIVVKFDFQDAGVGRQMRWQVAYERVDHLQGDSEDGATVREAVVLAAGDTEP